LDVGIGIVTLSDIDELVTVDFKGVKIRSQGRQIKSSLGRNNGGSKKILEVGVSIKPLTHGGGGKVMKNEVAEPGFGFSHRVVALGQWRGKVTSNVLADKAGIPH